MSGGNADGIYTAIPLGWGDIPPPDTRIRWFTGDPDADPWQWRHRVLNERDDVAYAKVFFRKGGYITREWYPYFLAARRDGADFHYEYESGAISHYAKRIYAVLEANGAVPIENIKKLGGFTRKEKSRVESALIELQTKLYITICGSFQKISRNGAEYGWTSNVFCTAETFWGSDVFEKAAKLSCDDAYDAISERIYALNPDADDAKIHKFIMG